MTGALAATGLIGMAAPASAADRDGNCDSTEVCLYWGGNRTGSFADYGGWVADFAGHTFVSPGQGRCQRVKNNVASAWNKDPGWVARVWYNENYTGPYDDVQRASWRNLVNAWNDNASPNWRR